MSNEKAVEALAGATFSSLSAMVLECEARCKAQGLSDAAAREVVHVSVVTLSAVLHESARRAGVPVRRLREVERAAFVRGVQMVPSGKPATRAAGGPAKT